MLPGVLLSLKVELGPLSGLRPTCEFGENCRGIMETCVGDFTHSFCSTKELWKWTSERLNPVASGSSAVLIIGFVSLKLLLQYLRVWWSFCCILKLPTQYQFVSDVCHVYRTDTPFGFCMLTSVDKMFIRFIFAKDMQLHYIWYYKILIKTCSCYPCEQIFFIPSELLQCLWERWHC